MIDTDKILMLLGDIKEDIGGLRADARNAERQRIELLSTLSDHIKDDRTVEQRVASLETSRTRLRGTVAAYASAATAVVSLLGYLLKDVTWHIH